ncbi:uncharacterized protein BP5553_07975 [Venustampulla echinocandica]|uniref:Coupling of ubiquitin conjugation to ER degradation protein 1 n=1 Tax=Venustampulla echinocandica TaxID=2656787 RepID=A0A370TFD4_9HELO|nr:uncharacterized protein BP5553_07975 [Venustampulla echinocandica]RDL33607.1 hypothetical protein BP5553_07975 [Venustampulla echinocandica]
MSSTDQTINVPQLILIIVLGALAIRYFFFSSSANTSTTNRGTSSSSASNVRAREADVERIQQMFPQVSRRSIMWDLQRNGGNVVASTERILSGRGLEVPPQSFQPPLPAAVSSTTSTSCTSAQLKPAQPDLITRYNLQAKLAEEASISTDPGVDEKSRAKQAWSQNKGERQALLQRRREEMILAARRKMEAKVAAEAALGKPDI